MAEAKTINTRIVLRNDLISKWMTSDKALLKGEAALALRPDGNYEIRFGSSDSLSTWSQLSNNGQLVIPAKNVEFLTYQEYQLSSLTTSEGEQSKFQLWGKRSDTAAWESIGAAITVPEVDFGPVNAKIEYLSGAIDKLSSDLSGEIDALSTSLSTTVDALVATTKSDVLAEVKNVSAETLISAAADATSKANQALADAKTYTNEVSTALSTDYQGQINKIKTEIADGIHFIGHVAAYGLTKDGETVTGGWYKLKADGQQIAAKNGDLIIYNNKEYIWSNAQKSWDEFGDEGNYATKQYVDDKASAAESNAISATENNVYQETNLTDEQVTNYLSASNKNVGDVLINKKDIKDNTGTSVGKQEYTAYSWDGSAWTAMDGNYSAANVYFKDNIKITYTMGKYSASAASPKDVAIKGWTVQDLFADAWAEVLQPTITLPTISMTADGGTGEIGTSYTLPARTLKFNEGSYQYAPTSTKISVEIGNMEIYRNDDTVNKVTNDVVKVHNGTITLPADTTTRTYLSGGASYNYTGKASYTASPVQPKTNIGTTSTKSPIAAGTCTNATKTATYTGYYPTYYGFSATPKDNPTAITANNSGTVTVNGVTYTRKLNTFNETQFTASGSWCELFYLQPKAKTTKTKWTGKNSNNIDLPVEACTDATVTFMDGTTAAYRVFVVRNAAAVGATTCKMTLS